MRGSAAAASPPNSSNPYPAWTEFEASQEAGAVPEWLVDQLRAIRWPRGEEPTAVLYHSLASVALNTRKA